MSKRTERQTKIQDLHQGDTIKFGGFLYNVTRNIPEADGTFTLQYQAPGRPGRTFHRADHGFMVTRIGF